jgi:hypothetical protein
MKLKSVVDTFYAKWASRYRKSLVDMAGEHPHYNSA